MPENQRLIQETGSPSTVGLWERYIFDGYAYLWSTYEEGLLAWKFDSAVPLPSGRDARAIGYEGSPPAPTTLLEYVSQGVNGTPMELEGELTFKIITEDFTLSTIDKAGIESLSGQTATPRRLWCRGDANSGLDLDHLEGQEEARYVCAMAGSAGAEIYGFALYVSDYLHTAEGYNVDDEYHFDAKRASGTDVKLLLMG